MEYLNKKKLIEELKNSFQLKTKLNKEYNLLKNKTIRIVVNDNDFFLNTENYGILLFDGKKGIEKVWKSSNYMTLSEEVYTYLKNKNLLIKENSISIISDIVEKETISDNNFSFFSEIDKRFDNSDLKEFKEETIIDFFSEGNYIKVVIDGDQMQLIKGYGVFSNGKYTKNGLIMILVKYINMLINYKKTTGKEINKTIDISFKDHSNQKLSIIEGEEGEIITSKDDGFIDNNLVNQVFTLCSLSDLVINQTQLKIWLNKIIKKGEIKNVYF